MTADFGGLRMKHLFKIIALISALCLMLGMLSGCGSVEVEYKNYVDVVPDTLENLENGVVAESDDFTMIWNKSSVGSDGNEYYRAAIEFVSKKDGSVWSTTPKSYYDTVDSAALFGAGLINSSVVVVAKNGERIFTYDAYEQSIMNGRFASAKCEDKNGITVTYYFDNSGIIVSVDYYLEDGAFKVAVDPKKVNSYMIDTSANEGIHGTRDAGPVQSILNVTPAPFVCSAENTPANSKDNYLVVPSGSGALMYTDLRSDASVRAFGDFQINPESTEGMVYGEDLAVDKYDDPVTDTPITMPFYGVKKGNTALCAIIEQGAEACKITARAGDATLGADYLSGTQSNGYSYIAASYSMIGYDFIYSDSRWRLQYNEYIEQNLQPLVIGYYHLGADQANYTGMAKRYQKYLADKENLKKSQDNQLLNVKFYGSFLQDELFAGIPYKKDIALTTYDQATAILDELKKISGGSLTAIMQGYGDGGVDSDKLAGGFKLTGVAGSKEDLKEFVEYTNSNGIKTFFNFDVVKFYESTKGFSLTNDVALNTNGIPAPVYNFLISTRERHKREKGGKVGALVARDTLNTVVNDAVALTDKLGITGIGFNTLGNLCYSDYTEVEIEGKEYFRNPLRTGMADDVKTITANTQENSKTVLMDGAFSYAATAADVITNMPNTSNRNNEFDLEVPLYQIVFQGYKANSVSAINLATNKRTQFLKAIETGSGLSFDIINDYNFELRKITSVALNAAVYADNAKLIEDYVTESKAFLTSVAGATIVDHQYLTEDVVKTVFDNGVTVLVNYGDTDYTSEFGVVKAQGFLNK